VANIMVHPVHFEDFSGIQFERLVFAYHIRAGWTNLAWLGQTGGDKGRDIIGTEEFDDRPSMRTIIQCANRDSLTLAKARADMEKAVNRAVDKPDAFKFVCRGPVPNSRRADILQAARALKVGNVTIWSGVEFEENLRLRGEYLLHRFVMGKEFPEAESEIREIVDDFPDLSDDGILSLMAAVFDRPAFRTPFELECSLPAFQQAIEDTISALSTGIWKTRDGTEIRRLPSLHHIKDKDVRKGVMRTVRQVDELRRIFVRRLRDGSITHCNCGDANCPTFMLQPGVSVQLDAARSRALETFRLVYPQFAVVVR
jgi:hypothetical protein